MENYNLFFIWIFKFFKNDLFIYSFLSYYINMTSITKSQILYNKCQELNFKRTMDECITFIVLREILSMLYVKSLGKLVFSDIIKEKSNQKLKNLYKNYPMFSQLSIKDLIWIQNQMIVNLFPFLHVPILKSL